MKLAPGLALSGGPGPWCSPASVSYDKQKALQTHVFCSSRSCSASPVSMPNFMSVKVAARKCSVKLDFLPSSPAAFSAKDSTNEHTWRSSILHSILWPGFLTAPACFWKVRLDPAPRKVSHFTQGWDPCGGRFAPNITPSKSSADGCWCRARTPIHPNFS